MKRRSFLGRIAAAVAVAPLAAMASTAPRAEAACAECARIFDGDFTVPVMFARPSAEVVALAREATHARALREGISHGEAALLVYWEAFSTHTVVEPMPLVYTLEQRAPYTITRTVTAGSTMIRPDPIEIRTWADPWVSHIRVTRDD